MADTNTQQQNSKDFGDQINQELKKLLKDKKNVQPKKTEVTIKRNRKSSNLGQRLTANENNASEDEGTTAGNESSGEPTEPQPEAEEGNESGETTPDQNVNQDEEKQDAEAGDNKKSTNNNENGKAYEPESALKLNDTKPSEKYSANPEEKRTEKNVPEESEQNKAEKGQNDAGREEPNKIAPKNESETKNKVDKSKRMAKDETEEESTETKREKADEEESASSDQQGDKLGIVFTNTLKAAWEDKYTGFLGWYGFSLLYINFHFVMSYLVNSPSFCKFGDEKSKNISITDSEFGRLIIMFLADFLIILLITTLFYAGYSALPWLAKKCIENGDNWVGQACTAGAKTISNVITAVTK